MTMTMDRQSIRAADQRVKSVIKAIANVNQAVERTNDDPVRNRIDRDVVIDLQAEKTRCVKELLKSKFGIQEEDYHWDIIVSSIERSLDQEVNQFETGVSSSLV